MKELAGGILQSSRGDEKSQSLAGLPGFLPFMLRRILPMNRVNELCEQVVAPSSGIRIQDRILEALHVKIGISNVDEKRIPSGGPLVVVANHPFGAVEGLILASILQNARNDFKILANFMLSFLGLKELDEIFFLVDPFEKKESVRQNLKPIKDAMEWLRGGRSLGIFPAGEVSHLHLNKRRVFDKQWNPAVARIIRKTEATVLPVYFEGHNSVLFCMLGLLHPVLRTLMLPREAFNKQHRTIRVHIGKPVPFNRLAQHDNASMMEYLRLRTYNLQYRSKEVRAMRFLVRKPARAAARKPIVGQKPSALLAEEISRLPGEQVLYSSRDLSVLSATAAQIPEMLHEIGRLREVTFREAGEGTGLPIDLDTFDEYYNHIVIWNRAKQELVAACRLGLADSIIRQRGLAGLYTDTLFDYKESLFHVVAPALEVGRSFVRPEYQKTYQPLLLLWTGIGRFVADRPRYRFLFGAVSINNDYHGISRQMIVHFLKNGHFRSDLAPLAKGRNPFARRPVGKQSMSPAYSLVEDVQDLSQLVSDIERDEKGIPILLKHYMKLGGEFLGFNVDPHFNDALDALVLVDLLQTEPRILEKYMGPEGMRSFFRFHDIGQEGLKAIDMQQDRCA
jgi:putative hemolysin